MSGGVRPEPALHGDLCPIRAHVSAPGASWPGWECLLHAFQRDGCGVIEALRVDPQEYVDACRNVAYLERRGESRPPAPAVTPATLEQEYAYEVEHVERLRPRDRTEIARWIEMGQKFDEIIDSHVMLARFMDELLCRMARSALLENHRNQRAVNQFVVIYFMVGRMTDGDFTLPVIAQ